MFRITTKQYVQWSFNLKQSLKYTEQKEKEIDCIDQFR